MLIHMLDDGESFLYLGRSGWECLCEGLIQAYRTSQGTRVTVYDCPRHYMAWRYV